MSYELYRNEVINGLSDVVQEDLLEKIMNILDNSAQKYDIKKKEVALSIISSIPDIVRDYIAAKATENLKKGTLTNYYNLLKNFFLTVRKNYDQIETNDVRTFLQYYQMQRNQCDRTKNQNKIYLNSFFEWLLNEGYINKNPVRNMKAIKYHETRRYVLSTLEVEMMRCACETLRERAVFDVLYSSGLRVSELCSLKKQDVDFENREIHVRHGKGDKERITYFNASAVMSLRAYLNSREDTSDYVIVGLRGERKMLDKRTIEEEIARVSERAGLSEKKIRPHNLRHTFATRMIANGCPVEIVQMMLGHSKISTTMIYAHIAQNDIKVSYEKYAV